MRAGTLAAYRWELRKLLSQKRTYMGLGLMVALPLIFVFTIGLRHDHHDQPEFFMAYVTQTGLAVPLVVLLFASGFFLPVALALVSGDIVSAEDHNGTLKTILTRSLDRGQIFVGKLMAAVTYAIALLLVLGTVATVAGIIRSGFNPLVTLGGTSQFPLPGTTVAAAKALELVYASLAVYLMPTLAVVAIGVLLSTATRNSAGAIVGTVMAVLIQHVVEAIPGLSGLRPYTLVSQFDAWQGLLHSPIDWSTVGHSAWVSAAYAVPCVIAAYYIFRNRDVAGG